MITGFFIFVFWQEAEVQKVQEVIPALADELDPLGELELLVAQDLVETEEIQDLLDLLAEQDQQV